MVDRPKPPPNDIDPRGRSYNLNLRCLLGIHNVPGHLTYYRYYGAVFQGGECLRCKKWKQGKFLFNVWDEDKIEKFKHYWEHGLDA